MRSIQTEMIVMKEDGDSLKSMIKIPLFMKGRISIVWHRRILEDSESNLQKTEESRYMIYRFELL